MAPSHHPLMEPDEDYRRRKAVEAAENQILKIVEALENEQNVTVTEVIGNPPGLPYHRIVVCWKLNS